MKKGLWLLLCVCLWGWMLPPQAHAQGGDQHYQANSFSFAYPATWVLTDTRSPQGLILLANTPDALERLAPASGEVVVAIAPPHVTAALAPDADRPLALIKDFVQDSDAVLEDIRLDNGPAAKAALLDDGYDNLLVSVALDGKTALLIATAPIGELDTLDETLMALVASMRYQEVIAPRLNANYTVGVLDIEFRYPSDWYIRVDPDEPNVSLFNSRTVADQPRPLAGDIGIVIGNVPPLPGLTATTAPLDALQAVSETLPDSYQHSTPVLATVGEYDAAQMYMTNEILEAYLFVIQLNPSQSVMALAATAPGDLSIASPTILTILSSVQSIRRLEIRIIG